MNVRIMRLLLVVGFLPSAHSFLNGYRWSVPYGNHLIASRDNVFERCTVNKGSCRPNSALVMAIKLFDKDRNNKPKKDESGGVSRFLGGIFRSEKEEEPEKEEDERSFVKSMSTRLSFRRESESGRVGGFQVSGDPVKLINFSLGSSDEVKDSNIGKQKSRNDEDKRLQKLRKKIAKLQKNVDEQEEGQKKELERKKKVELEARKKEELEKKVKVEAKERKKKEIERKRKEELERKRKDELEKEKQLEKQQKAQVTELELSPKKDDVSKEEEKEKKRTSTTSVFMEFVSNIGKNVVKALKDEEKWVVVLPKTRLSPGEIVPVNVRGIDLLIVGSRDGKVHCLANSCPHLGTPLETGRLESRPKVDANGNMILTSTLPPKIDSEDCIVCPLHHTAFALESGEVRGEWCPYPPVIGKVMGTVKTKSPVALFDIRTRGKNIEVRINSPVQNDGESSTPKPESAPKPYS